MPSGWFSASGSHVLVFSSSLSNFFDEFGEIRLVQRLRLPVASLRAAMHIQVSFVFKTIPPT